MKQLESSGQESWHPLDHVETLLEESDLDFERLNDNALVMHVLGTWSHIDLYFQWNKSAQALFVICESDIRISALKRDEIFKLVGMINESIIMGHFEIRSSDDCLVFRHGMFLRGTNYISGEQLEDVIDIGLREFERHYPSFQLLIWGGHKAESAMELSMFETLGEA